MKNASRHKGTDDLQTNTSLPTIILTYGSLGTIDKLLFTSIQNTGEAFGRKTSVGSGGLHRKDHGEPQIAVREHFRGVKALVVLMVYIGRLDFIGVHGMTSMRKNFSPFVLSLVKMSPGIYAFKLL